MTHHITSHYSSVDLHDGDTSKYGCKECEIEKVRNSDGTVKLRNPNIEKQDQDFLYHLALGTATHNLVAMFSDVKFVCCGGTPERMRSFAECVVKELRIRIPGGLTLHDISKIGHRYSMFKIGPVISVSHGMGGPSISILLHELIKLMYHAKVRDPIFFRLGTCGGVGLPPGTVVISESCTDGMLDPYLALHILGKEVKRPSVLDAALVQELAQLSEPDDKFILATGTTMCTNDFYEGQGRIDGAFADHTEEEKLAYLNEIHKSHNIINIEMESTVFAALTHHAGIKAGVLCVTLLDRLKGDQILSSMETLNEFQERPQVICIRYIKKYLEKRGRI